MALPLKTKVFWTIYRRLEGAPVMQQPPDKVRAASDRRKKMLTLPGATLLVGRADPGAEITDSTFALDDGTVLPLRIYRPRGASGTLPVVVNFHGGGWVSGDPRQSEWWCSAVAVQAKAVVVSVDVPPRARAPVPDRGRGLLRHDRLGRSRRAPSSASTRNASSSWATAPAATSPRWSR